MDEALRRQIADAAAAARDDARPGMRTAMHAGGRLTARERIDTLLDTGSFAEYGILTGRTGREDDTDFADGLVCGGGRVAGLPVMVAASDRSVLDGTQSDRNQRKLSRILQIAEREHWPLVLLLDGDGARPDDPLPPPPVMVNPRGRWGLYDGLAHLNGRLPTVACILGRALDGEAGAALLCDFCVAVRGTPIGTRETDGTLTTHPAEDYAKRGDIDRVENTELAALLAARQFLGYHLPDRPDRDENPDYPSIATIIPDNRRRPYDMRQVIHAFADADSTLELQPDFGRSMLTVLARLYGRPIGIFANQPKSPLAGSIDPHAADKATRFIEMCDAYGFPLVSFIDNPGFMVGPQAEADGMARHHARPLAALHHRTVPLCSVQIRKAYGLGPYAMYGWGTSHNAPLLKLAWPTVESGGMSLEGAAYLVKRREIQAAATREEAMAIRDEYAEKMRSTQSGLRAGRIFHFDDIIDPLDTRTRIGEMLARTAARRFGAWRHGIELR
ncbi:MAG: carboxyl transferase domain-containing protein [Pseudomonadales bacterium]